MKFSTIINNILTLKSWVFFVFVLVSIAFGSQLLNIYILGPKFLQVHDVKVKAEKLITHSNVQTKGRVGRPGGRLLSLKDGEGAGERQWEVRLAMPGLLFSPCRSGLPLRLGEC